MRSACAFKSYTTTAHHHGARSSGERVLVSGVGATERALGGRASFAPWLSTAAQSARLRPPRRARYPAWGACRRQCGAGAGVGRGESQGRGGRRCRVLGEWRGRLCVVGLVVAPRRVLSSVPSCSPLRRGEALLRPRTEVLRGTLLCGRAQRCCAGKRSTRTGSKAWLAAAGFRNGANGPGCRCSAARAGRSFGPAASAVSYARASERRGLRRKILCSRQPAGADAALKRMCTERGRVLGGAGLVRASRIPRFLGIVHPRP